MGGARSQKSNEEEEPLKPFAVPMLMLQGAGKIVRDVGKPGFLPFAAKLVSAAIFVLGILLVAAGVALLEAVVRVPQGLAKAGELSSSLLLGALSSVSDMWRGFMRKFEAPNAAVVVAESFRHAHLTSAPNSTLDEIHAPTPQATVVTTGGGADIDSLRRQHNV